MYRLATCRYCTCTVAAIIVVMMFESNGKVWAQASGVQRNQVMGRIHYTYRLATDRRFNCTVAAITLVNIFESDLRIRARTSGV